MTQPPLRIPPIRNDTALVPTNSTPGELHQIRAHIESTRTCIRFLEALFEPPAAGEVNELKKIMRDAHQRLERLQQHFKIGENTASMDEVTVATWQVYQQLVKLEENLRRVHNYVPEPEDIQPAVLPTSSCLFTRRKSVEPRHPSCPVSPKMTKRDCDVCSSRLENPQPWVWPRGKNNDEEDEYVMSGALPVRSPVGPSAESVKSNGNAQRPTDSASKMDSLGSRIIKSPLEVGRSCLEEESCPRAGLRNANRQRGGSLPGYYVSSLILGGVKDSRFFLPELRFIKIHELKRLKEWLAKEYRLSRTGSISRIEKVLHLVLLLQEGCRIESMAVLFSRTPQQVRDSCHQVFSMLLEMHSKTEFEPDRPNKQLWDIGGRVTNGCNATKWEQHYGWASSDIAKVLATLDMYMGRFRQQGTVALRGPYVKWWKHFE